MHLPFPLPVLPPHYFCIICAYLLISFLLSHLRVALSNPLVPVSSAPPPIHSVTPFRSSSRSHRGSPRLRKVVDICLKPFAKCTTRFYTFRVTRETFFTLRSFRHAWSRDLQIFSSSCTRETRRAIVLAVSCRRRCPRASSVYLFPSRNFPPILRLSATYETPNGPRRDDCSQNFEDQVSS